MSVTGIHKGFLIVMRCVFAQQMPTKSVSVGKENTVEGVDAWDRVFYEAGGIKVIAGLIKKGGNVGGAGGWNGAGADRVTS